MKRLIILAVLLVSVNAFGAGVLGVANPAKVSSVTTPDKICGVAGMAGASCDSCTSNLIFSSHFEGTGNSTTAFDVTTGTPCGCSADASKDITYFNAAVNSADQKVDGSYSFYRAGTTDYATFPVTGIAVDDAVSFEFNFRFASWVANGTIVRVSDADSTDYVTIQMDTTDDLKVTMYVGGALAGSASWSDWSLQANTWYVIRVRTRHGSTDPWCEITYDGANDLVDNDNPGNFSDAPTEGRLGSTVTYGHDIYVDVLNIYDTWKTGDEWGD